MSSFKLVDWSLLIGVPVEIRQWGRTIRRGVIDSVMPDSSVLWIASEGVQPRAMFEAALGYEVWVGPEELPGGAAYRMASDLLRP